MKSSKINELNESKGVGRLKTNGEKHLQIKVLRHTFVAGRVDIGSEREKL